MQHSEQTHALTREILRFLKRHGKPRATQGTHPRKTLDTYLQDVEDALQQGLPELKSRVIWAVGRLARNPEHVTLKGLVRAFQQRCQHDEALWLKFPVNLNHLPEDVQQSLRTHLEQQEDQVFALTEVIQAGLYTLGHPSEGKP
ncbi:hypothetical protein [Deinococcus cellulosilyticus]|uniref:Uncharacterized protein n=1 Tax=Deinococcus cellulosilyticus (strain DSM 18568 / NBRC 106333 / KACC 11606 / 5516J-15) TaxID=1223518 RepID=A0A511NAD7_DEIC1|nr:hypothetical protein [Deinococcus cellulosilyticus]GEM49458.1 hypothetical protein DC3_50930 [Deinococcus cellulosilyticus NBRC 106333 = KACC 11606]